MSANLANLAAKQYATNIKMLLQQKGSRLRGKVDEKGSYKGEQASPVDQVGTLEMTEVISRFGPMGRQDAPVARRWLFPTMFELPQLVDTFDEAKMVEDPKSTLVQTAVAAAGRKIDLVLLSAMLSTAKTGKEGSDNTIFTATQEVAVNHEAAGNTGLTVAKLRAAKKLMLANEVDEDDPIYMAITATQHDNLLREAQVVSTDFNDKPVLVEGKIQRFLGINFVHTELVAFSTYRQVPVWAKSGVHLGIWQDIQTRISQRNDLSGEPWQAYCKMIIGATRLEEKKVVRILCAE